MLSEIIKTVRSGWAK